MATSTIYTRYKIGSNDKLVTGNTTTGNVDTGSGADLTHNLILGDSDTTESFTFGGATYNFLGKMTVGTVNGFYALNTADNSQYFFSTDPNAGNGTTVARFADTAATPNDFTLVASGQTTADTTAPTVTGVTYGANDGNLAAGETVQLNVTFSEAVTLDYGTGTPTLTLNTGGTATYVSGSGTSTLVFSYTPSTGQTTSDLTVTAFNLGTATVTDATGNGANTTGAVTNPAGTLAVDTTAPTVSGVTYGANDGNLAAGETVQLNVTFSEAVTIGGTGTPTLTLNTGGTATYVSGSGTSTLVFSYTPSTGQTTSDLTVTAFNLGTATLKDAAGNGANTTGAVTNPAGTLAVDTTAPTVSGVTYGANDGNLAAGETVQLNVTFSEAVTIGGTGTPTLTLNTGGTATYVSGSGTSTLVFSYTPSTGQTTSDLTVTAFNLGTATLKDAAGNGASTAGAVTNPAGTLAVDTTAPTVSGVTYGANDGNLAAGETVQLNVTFSEAVTIGGTGTPTLTLNTGGTATYVSGSGTSTLVFSYTPSTGQTTSDLTVTAFNLGTATLKDAAGNGANTTGAVTNPAGTLAVDTSAPTVTGFTADAGTFVVGQTATFTLSASESALAVGSTLTLSNGATATYFSGSGTGTLVYKYTVQLGDAESEDVTVTSVNGVTDLAGNPLSFSGNPEGTTHVICFYPGTLIATPDGQRAVETLVAGDLVLTSEGKAKPIRWMGRQTVSRVFGDQLKTLPIRIAAGALGENLPVRDLLVSPAHALALDGVLVQAGALVNGTSITRESNVPASFTYYHIELADQSLILAEGVPAETFIDNADREAFDNWEEHPALEAPMAELALPRAMAHRQVPMAIRQRIAARAAALFPQESAAA